jgi:hypothetical protein
MNSGVRSQTIADSLSRRISLYINGLPQPGIGTVEKISESQVSDRWFQLRSLISQVEQTTVPCAMREEDLLSYLVQFDKTCRVPSLFWLSPFLCQRRCWVWCLLMETHHELMIWIYSWSISAALMCTISSSSNVLIRHVPDVRMINDTSVEQIFQTEFRTGFISGRKDRTQIWTPGQIRARDTLCSQKRP